MLFNNPRKYESYNFNNNNNNVIQFKLFNLNNIQNNISNNTQSNIKNNNNTINNIQIQKENFNWSEPTWNFIHAIAIKFNENKLDDIKKIIQLIIENLPCINCSEHSKQYLEKKHINRVRTKKELIEYLYIYHSYISKKKFDNNNIDSLNEKYNNMNFTEVSIKFLNIYTQKTNNFKQMQELFFRIKIKNFIIKWLNENSKYIIS